MARRRFLVGFEVLTADGGEFAALQEQRFAACPEAAAITDEEAESFLEAAQYIDSVDAQTLVKRVRQAGIAFPPDLAYDPYRLGRHLFRRWGEPAIRRAVLERVVDLDFTVLLRLKRKGDIAGLAAYAEAFGAPATFGMMRRCAMADLIPRVQAAFTAEQAAKHRALYQVGKLTQHRFLTEPEPARQPSPWEQRKLARRLRLREVQVRSLRRNLVTLRRERRALVARLRQVEGRDLSELNALAAELGQLRAAQEEAGRRHAAALAEQARSYEEQLAALRAEVGAAEQEYARVLALRSAWLISPGGEERGVGLAVSDPQGRRRNPGRGDRRADGSGSGRRVHIG